MGLFFSNFKTELQRLISELESPDFKLTENWAWWDKKEETLFLIEREDLEVIAEIKKLYRRGHLNRRLTSEILRLAIELKEEIELMMKKPDFKLQPQQAQHVTDLLLELGAFLKEQLSMETLGIEIHNKVLFHGSSIPGLRNFNVAEEKTIGTGIYLTDEAVAVGYARWRVQNRGGKPVIYKFLIKQAWFADFSNNHKVKVCMQHFKEALKEIQNRPGIPWYFSHTIERAIQQINTGSIGFGNMRDVTFNIPSEFTNFLEKYGYEGLIAWEGGEGEIRNHISYVLFDPKKAILLEEIHV